MICQRKTYPTRDAEGTRRAKLAQVHIAKAQLAMMDDDYRAMLKSQCGVDSSAALDMRGLDKLLAHLRKCGFKPKAPAKADGKDTSSMKLADDAQSKMLRGLWLQAHAMGVVRDSSEMALLSWVKRMTGKDRLEWITSAQASRLIEQMKKWTQRVADASQYNKGVHDGSDKARHV